MLKKCEICGKLFSIDIKNFCCNTCFEVDMQQKIKALAKKYAAEFIEVRHHLHAHPELSYQEFETSKFVQDRLKDLGIPFEVKATTGVVGLIKGKNPDKNHCPPCRYGCITNQRRK